MYHLARDKKNNLEVLKIDGNNVTDQAKIQEKVLDYFEKLFNKRLDRKEDFVMDEGKLHELLNDNLCQVTDADKEMELLLVNLEAECKGIRIGDSAELDEPYADDVEVLLDDDKDFVKVNQMFEKFESLSGAVLSRSEKAK